MLAPVFTPLFVMLSRLLLSSCLAAVALIPISPGGPQDIGGDIKVTLQRSGTVNGIPGAPVLRFGADTLELLDPVTLSSGGQLVTVYPPKHCEQLPVLRGHMLTTITKSCKLRVETVREKAPRIPAEILEGNVTFPVEPPVYYNSLSVGGRKTSRLWKLNGHAGHFVALRMTDAQVLINAHTGKKYAEADLQVVTSFGARSIKVSTLKRADVTIGPEAFRFAAFLIERDRPDTVDKFAVSFSGGGTAAPGGEPGRDAVVASYGE